MNNKLLLGVGIALVLFGLFKPSLNFPVVNPNNNNTIVVVTPPQEKALRDKCQLVIDAFADGSTDRKKDGARLSDLYMDLATLIELDGEDEVVKTTEEVRQANSLCGVMLRMNVKGKYPGLADAAQSVIIVQIGDDIVPLDSDLRKKSAEAFRALAWACNEGTK